MSELWQNPLLQAEMGKKSRQRVEKFFSASATGNTFLNIYREILGEV
jgi:glycosyltransferase involved in cell wall biosynthesis